MTETTTIKCFALWQPWATLVIIKAKLIETRPQYSRHRGITGIHATLDNKQYAAQNEKFFYSEPCYRFMKAAGYTKFEQLPRGMVLGTVEVYNWKKMVIGVPRIPQVETNYQAIDSIERNFGHYAPGRYAIYLSNVNRFKQPVLAKGQQNMLFDVKIPSDLLNITKNEKVNSPTFTTLNLGL